MNHHFSLISVIIAVALDLCVGAVVAGAQIPTVSLQPVSPDLALECRFDLTTASPGRVDYDLPPFSAGPVRLQAAWTGDADALALMVSTAPTGTVLGRVTGASPLALDLNIATGALAAGNTLRVSLVSVGSGQVAHGWLLAEPPGSTAAIDPMRATATTAALDAARGVALAEPLPTPSTDVALQPRAGQVERMQADRTGNPPTVLPPPVRPSECGAATGGVTVVAQDTVRTVLPDGRVEIRYPDGRITRHDVNSTCWEVVQPNGPATILCPHSNVIRTELADLPPELLARDGLDVWLEDLNPHLLDAIREIIADPAGFQNYTNFESGRSLPEQIDLRLRLLNTLLEVQ